MSRFLMNTVLFERNRWEPGRNPSLSVSEWMGRMKEDGFDGIELWENHALKSSDEEIEALKAHSLSVEIYNSYVSFDDDQDKEREEAAAMIHRLQPKQVKFNFGDSEASLDVYIRNLKEWEKQLPEDCELLCECHPGTVMEDPETARDVLEQLRPMDVKAIIHPFHAQVDLKGWFDHLEEKIVHAHVSLFKNHVFHALEEEPEFIQERLQILKDSNYRGSFSMEFTKGVAEADETPQEIYTHAVKDVSYLKRQLQKQEVQR
ncbi:TIM barrel protein [Halobacillus sp. HZG1]|uniref:sugar phosphate isomerase/epimerase family protein n=1 Tax=Halobacillus sp. HZG1 TaxID=3111769 RepID=UPI002DB5F28B|nr:TIM barrel protein [Halobacillus sp. HZG1]MEC3884008.1 TIM barrel protein [Halobacillus sp. HZG1]